MNRLLPAKYRKDQMTNSRDEASVQELLLGVVRSIVDQPEKVSIDISTSPDRSLFRIHVHSSDIGKVIGKQGRMSRALRIIVHANGVIMKRRLSIDIVDPSGPEFKILLVGDESS